MGARMGSGNSNPKREPAASGIQELDRDTLIKAVEISMHAVVICDLDLNIEWSNEEFFRKFHIGNIEDAVGMSVLRLFPDQGSLDEPLRELFETGRWQGEVRMNRDADEVIDVLLTSTLLCDPSGEPLKIIATGIDITEERTAETRARKSEEALTRKTELLDSILQTASDVAIATTDLDLRITYYNSMAEKFFGYTADEVIGRTVMEMHLKENVDPERLQRVIEIVRNTGEYYYFITQDTAEGPRYIESRIGGIFGSEGALTGFSLFSRDITGRKLAEEALIESENNLRALFSSMTDIVFEMDYDGMYVNIAPTSPELMFNPPDSMIGKTLHEVFPKPEADRFLAFIRRSLDEGRTCSIEYPMVIEDRTLWFEGKATPKTDKTVLYIAHDITAGKLAEEDRVRLTSAIEQSSEIIEITDSEAVILYVNPAYEKITGYSREEVIGLNPRLLQSGEHDEDFYREMWATLTSGNTWSGRLVNRRKDGVLYTEDATISPVRDAAGEIINYVAVKRDITEDIKQEEQLLQSHKMEAVGELAGGIAHDFNNLLQVISGFTEMALSQIPDTHPAHGSIREVETAGNRAKILTSQLLAFSHQQIINPVNLDLNDIITGLLKMLHRVIGEHIKCVFTPETETSPVNGDRGQLEQVMLNLCINSRDAMPDGGEITIRTQRTLLDDDFVKANPWASPGSFVLLSVTDTGTGIDEKTMDRMFDPFFTTKEIGRGTGLGLSTAYGIVMQHDGHIRVESREGIGTTFRIYLPLAEFTETSSVESVDEPVRGGIETILLAEDDMAVRNLTVHMLENAGYTVLRAENGVEALKLFKINPEEISLALLDVVMPELGGRQVYDRMKIIQPDIRVLFTSGYSYDAFHTGFILDEGLQLIQKPYTPADLLRQIRRVLDS